MPRRDPEDESRVRRTFDLREWETSNRILVGGELAAFIAAVLAIVLDYPGREAGKWCIYIAAAMAAGALAWYAIDRTSQGDMPLTGISARRIARVAKLVNAQTSRGLAFDWDTISPDGKHIRASLLGIEPAVKRRILEVRLRGVLTTVSPEQLSQAVAQMSDAEVNELLTAIGANAEPYSILDD